MVAALPAAALASFALGASTSLVLLAALVSGIGLAGGTAGWFAAGVARASSRHGIVPAVAFWLAGATLGCAALILVASVDLASRNTRALGDVLFAWPTSALPWTLLLWCFCLIATIPSAILWPLVTPLIASRSGRS